MPITVTRTDPPSTPTGVTATAVNGYDKCYNEESGSLVDRTTEFITVASDVDSFAADDDYVYFSQEKNRDNALVESRISKLHIVLSTFASASIVPTFEYNTGNNTWATLAVTDGTNGFTQDGTITVTPATMPSITVWKVGSQNGSGNEIGDGVDRRYIRIKRTANTLATPPRISESGVGYLTANKTYYYKASARKSPTVFGSIRALHWLRSVPCAEVSATTTAVKRCIKIQWDTDAVAPDREVWRTPISGNYDYTARSTMWASRVDTEAQAVGCWYMNPRCSYTSTQNYVVDNGLSNSFVYLSTYIYQTNFYNNIYLDYAKGELVVSGGTVGTPASFEDVYLADVAAGWGTFIKTIQAVDQYQNEIYTCHDSLKIDDYFTDVFFNYISDCALWTSSSSTCMFGTRSSYGDVYGGGIFNLIVQRASQGMVWDFYNSQFNASRFIVTSFYSGNNYAHAPRFYDNCKLYDCVIEGIGILELPGFAGANIIIDGLYLYNARYGLFISSTAAPTISTRRVVLQGGTGIYGAWGSNTNIIFRNFEYRNGNRLTVHFWYSGADLTNNIYFVNLIVSGPAAGQIDKALIGPNWTLYEQYEFALKVADSTGAGIAGANVSIVDSVGTVVATLTTDVLGDITQQDITYKKYRPGTLVSATYHHYYADVITTHTPHTITISKSGYVTKVIKLTMDRKREEVETLEQVKDLNFSKRAKIWTQ